MHGIIPFVNDKNAYGVVHIPLQKASIPLTFLPTQTPANVLHSSQVLWSRKYDRKLEHKTSERRYLAASTFWRVFHF